MKKDYYILQLDNYNQPNGIIESVTLTKEEYENIKKTKGYIFKEYDQALERAYN